MFWYKARVRNDFRMGSPALWRWHRRMYNAGYDDAPPPGAGKLEKPRTGSKPLVTVQKLSAAGSANPPPPKPKQKKPATATPAQKAAGTPRPPTAASRGTGGKA